MKTITKFLTGALLIGSTLSLSAQTGTVKKPKVLFIGIDGVRSDALQQANTPNIDTLMAHGLYTFDSWHCGATSSGASWSTMMTGVWEAKHQVTNNSYTNPNYANYPYFPKRAKECLPNLKAVQIITWDPMNDPTNSNNSAGFVFNSGLTNLSMQVHMDREPLRPPQRSSSMILTWTSCSSTMMKPMRLATPPASTRTMPSI